MGHDPCSVHLQSVQSALQGQAPQDCCAEKETLTGSVVDCSACGSQNCHLNLPISPFLWQIIKAGVGTGFDIGLGKHSRACVSGICGEQTGRTTNHSSLEAKRNDFQLVRPICTTELKLWKWVSRKVYRNLHYIVCLFMLVRNNLNRIRATLNCSRANANVFNI